MKIKSSVSFLIVFSALVIAMGGVSIYKFQDFLISGKADYNEWTADLGSKAETKFATNFFNKFNFINLNGAVRAGLGQREMNGVVKLNNGYLLTTIGYISNEDLAPCAENIYNIQQYLSQKGIEFIYAFTPYTSSKYDTELPLGVEDFGNDNLDRLYSLLQERKIAPVDFREELYNDGIDQYTMMYKTDHHWNTEMGFYAFKKLVPLIEEKLNVTIEEELQDFSNYDVTVYKKWHLGSRGQRTGAYFAGTDDFHLITPKFETSIKSFHSIRDALVSKMNGEIQRGTYTSEIINFAPLKSRDATSRYTYDNTLSVLGKAFINYNARNDKRILLVSDSMGKAVGPFLVLSSSALYSAVNVDYRVIEEFNPDIVIIIEYGQNAVARPIQFIPPVND